MRRLNAELRFQTLGDDVAVADAPIVFEAHQADAAFACELSRFRKRKLAFRFGEAPLENAMHRLGVTTTRGFAAKFWSAERLYVNVADAGVGQARRENVLGETGAAREWDVAHVHQRLHFRRFQRNDEIRNTDAFIADGPDAAHCR